MKLNVPWGTFYKNKKGLYIDLFLLYNLLITRYWRKKMNNKVILEMSISQFKILEESLKNYRERLSYLLEKNEENFERFQDIKEKQKKLENILQELNL